MPQGPDTTGDWLLDIVVKLCGTCGMPITACGPSARRSPSRWSHARWGGWEGIRCPGRVTGAVPGDRTTTVGEWWAQHPVKETI